MSGTTSDPVKNLKAQLDATTQLLNDHLTNNLQLRSSMILLQQSHNDLAAENVQLKSQVSTLSAKVLELSPANTETVTTE